MTADDLAAAKQACRALARRLATPEGARRARAAQRAGRLDLPAPVFPPAAPAAGSPEPSRQRWPRPISIWEPRGTGAELVFARPAPLALGDHFATRAEIRPKREPLPLRVCLFGESAAAGYLYAPHVTPAGVLEAQLRAVAGEATVEVIDLARTNETLPSLLATLESAVQIQPDVLVIFAGNNWNLLETPEVSPYAPSVAARQDYAEAWRTAGGPAGSVHLAAERLRSRANRAFERVAQLAGTLRVPVILVVPEVGLEGWESRQPLLWPGDAAEAVNGAAPVANWYRLLATGRRHAARGAWTATERAARAMQNLDGGYNPTSWRLLAQARLGRGDATGAAIAARAEIDAAAYPTLAFLGAPQATTLVQDLVRSAARRHGFACVDLPTVFAEHTGSPLPGRRLFLDYCHLTAEGMEVGMAAVAAQVLRLSGIAGEANEADDIGNAGNAGDLGWRELLRRLPPLRVPPNVEAVARLGAAVHGAHRLLAVGAKASFLAAWCDAALAADPGIESAMLDLVAARAAPLPALLTPAQGRNLASAHRLGLPHGWRWDHLDAEVVLAIAGSLDRRAAAGTGTARKLVDELFARHHAPRRGGSDLLASPASLWEPLERFYPEVMSFDDLPHPAMLRAPWPETSFCLVCAADPDDVAIELTARLPLPPTATPRGPHAHDRPRNPAAPDRRRGSVRITVNGVRAASVRLDEAWSRPVLRIPRHALRPGLNRLTLEWPAPPDALRAPAIAAALDRLEQGIAADLHPVFGEVHSLVARPA